MNDWIRSDRGLPPVRQSVQVYCPEHNNQYTASVHEDGKWYYFGFSWAEVSEEVTHWKPLGRNPIRITPEQREVLQALKVLGYEWIAKDGDGWIYGYPDQPSLGKEEWDNDIWDSESESVVISRAPFEDVIAPLLPDWKMPLKIDDVLGVAE